jgi:small subunit ribosomal protein S1
MNHKKGDKVKGPIKSITDFGVFIGLPGGIDGLVHLSDLSWNEPAKKPCATSRRATKSKPWCWPSTSSASASPGHQAARRRPVHQLHHAERPWAPWSTGKVKSVDPRGAEIQLNDDVDRLPARLRDQPRPRRRRPQRAEGRRRSQRR